MELESHPTVTHPGGSSLAHDLPSPKSDTLTPKSHADRLDPPSKPPDPVVASAGTSRSKKDTTLSKKHVEKEDERDDKKTKPVTTIPLEPTAFEHDPDDTRATRYEPEPSKGKRASTRQDKQRERETLTPVLAPTATDHPATKPPASKPEEPPDVDPPGSPSDRLDQDADDAVFDDEDLSNTTPREDAPQDPEEDESKSHAHSTASSLSSVPDDFPLSRSVSPSPAIPERKRKRDELEVDDALGENEGAGTDDENDGEEEEAASLEEEEGSVDDDDEYQKKHREALHALTQIEIEFAKLRDKMYHEKIAELDEEVVMINNGTHPGLSAHMTEIEQKRQKRLDTAAAWKKHQQWSYHRQYEGFEYQANVHFIAKKSSLRREMISSLNAKQWKLEEEHNQLNEMIPPPNPIQDKQELMRRKKIQKSEAGDLKSIRETIGFPAAPHVHGLQKKDMDEDYEVLGLRMRTTTAIPGKTSHITSRQAGQSSETGRHLHAGRRAAV